MSESEPTPAGRDRLEQELRAAQSELAESRVEGTAGDGAVRVVMSGTQECLTVRIAPELAAAGQTDRLEQLIQQAVNNAIQESQLLAARRLSPLGGPR